MCYERLVREVNAFMYKRLHSEPVTHLDIIITQFQNLKRAQICNAFAQRPRKTVVCQIEYGHSSIICATDTFPKAVVDVWISPIGAIGPLSTF